MIAVLMIVISTASFTLSLLREADGQVTQDITDFARGSYDILIRPAGAKTDIEIERGIVEENYLGNGAGGISIEEWQQIKKHPDVEIAAPVASIGLFTARERTWMIEKDPTDAIYYQVDYSTNDGLHTYLSNESVYVYDFGDEDIFPSASSVADVWLGFGIASFDYPTSYHQVVAIDPTEEGKLVEFDFSPLAKSTFDSLAYMDGRMSTPIMSLSDATVPIEIELTIDELEQLNVEELEEIRAHFDQGNPTRTLYYEKEKYLQLITEKVEPKRKLNGETFQLIPDQVHTPFKQEFLYVNEEMKLESELPEFTGGGAFDYHSQRIGYRLAPVKYETGVNGELFVEQVGMDAQYQAPIYREMEEVTFYEVDDLNVPLNDEDFVGFIENGTFSIEENTELLASAPLGIYGREAPRLAEDESISLHPSAVPGSYITTPAHGLISIDWAERFKGDTPIDAIRVKVSGLSGYDQEAAAKIRGLAQEWKDQGFEVDIIAGASVSDITVNVEGVGKVIQPFTTLGAADTVLDSWNAVQVVVTILFIFVALTFIVFSFINLMKDRVRDEQLLAMLGWTDQAILLLKRKEWSLIVGIPIALSLLGFIGVGLFTEQWLLFYYACGISLLIMGLYILSNKYAHIDLGGSKRKKVKSFLFQNVRYYQPYIVAASIQLFFMTILSAFLPFFLLERVSSTVETRLGAYVHGEIEGIFIAVIILLYVLSFMTVFQSLQRMWRVREGEMRLFQLIGWEERKIYRYFIKEVLLWSSVASLLGWVVSILCLTLLVEVTWMNILMSTIGFFGIVSVTLLGSVLILYQKSIKGGKNYGREAA